MKFFPEPSQPCHRFGRLKKLLGLRLKQHHRCLQPELACLFYQLADNRLMAAMHAVKIADRGHATTMVRLQVMQSTYSFDHFVRLVKNAQDYRLDLIWSSNETMKRGLRLRA